MGTIIRKGFIGVKNKKIILLVLLAAGMMTASVSVFAEEAECMSEQMQLLDENLEFIMKSVE